MLIDPQNWDEYWGNKKSKILYDFIAYFYRILLIRPSLNYHLIRFTKPNSLLLHAGCGSGQVDKKIITHANIYAFDISKKALEMYSNNKYPNTKVVHGSIFNTEFGDKKFDGIYNLGVMEHFELNEISKILSEFSRILKDDGKIILFWPHKKGLSVNFIKIIKLIFLKLFKIKLKLHPDEITYVHSKQHISQILKQSNLQLTHYYFGIMDLFTQSVIIAEKEK